MKISGSPRDSSLRATLPPAFCGVRIAVVPGGPVDTVHVHGAFRVEEDVARDLQAPVVGSLVLVAQRDGEASAVGPFAEHVLFAEDEIVTSAGREGAFTIDVVAALGASRELALGHYYLFVAIGPHVSNVVEADVAG